MLITVTDGKNEKTCSFREGLTAGEIIAGMGFEFPMPCGGRGSCGKCICKINGKKARACSALIFSDSIIEIPPAEFEVLNAEGIVPGAEGVVIDIGTTTVAAARFENGCPVKTAGIKNPQCTFGADVISRIGAKDTRPLTECIQSLTAQLSQSLGSPAVITGNTAMLALFCGMDISGMGTYPFNMPSRFGFDFNGAYLPPCVGPFAGADALCSLLWSGAPGKNETAVVIDLGTNCEICLKHDGYYFTSAAAGPALEGAGISRGMAAARGAIFRADETGFQVIGGAPPKGICGSGLVDAIAMGLRSGQIDETGFAKESFEIPGSGIFITQQDIRAFQLCKGAISAALETLAEYVGLKIEDIDRIYLSGALGKNIRPASAIATGLLPELPIEKYAAIGNGALMGGAMLLLGQNRELAEEIAAEAKCLNPAADESFSRRYIAAMNFSVNGDK